MKFNKAHAVQFIVLLLIQSVAMLVLAYTTPGLRIHSLWSAITIVLIVSVVQSIVWWVFIEFFAKLPIFLYPLLTFALTGLGIAFVGNQIPGVTINGLIPALWIPIWLTVVNAILGGLFSLDEDSSFDRNVTRKMVAKYGNPEKTSVPGFLFLEIDGLSIDILKIALKKGLMPTLKSWLDSDKYNLVGWETDYSSQTGAMQCGILLGNNVGVPSYRWWNRKEQKVVMSGNPRDAENLEQTLSKGNGLLSNGGASRGNMFSGDATESLFTISSLLSSKRKHGPGFYFYLINPYVIARLITRFLREVIIEWGQQVTTNNKISARNPLYAFLRAFMGPFLEDLTTYAVISDVMRGVPAVYALYAGYDDLGHFTGMNSPEALHSLEETDRYFARIMRGLEFAPRPYHVVVLSDHGQSQGGSFQEKHGISLGELVKGLVGGEVYAAINTNEAWDNLNAVLSESTGGTTRGARLAKKVLQRKTKDGIVQIGPDRDYSYQKTENKSEKEANVLVFGSGCTGLIYFKNSKSRLTLEDINENYPNLVPGLISHPGIGFVVVRSKTRGTLVLGKEKNPLKNYGPNAMKHIERESGFENCPDILVATKIDPKTEELCGFENQVSHHGGLGGPQTRPFILSPKVLNQTTNNIVGAADVYKHLRQWRNGVK